MGVICGSKARLSTWQFPMKWMQIINKSHVNGIDLGQALHLDMCWHATHEDKSTLTQVMHVVVRRTKGSLKYTS